MMLRSIGLWPCELGVRHSYTPSFWLEPFFQDAIWRNKMDGMTSSQPSIVVLALLKKYYYYYFPTQLDNYIFNNVVLFWMLPSSNSSTVEQGKWFFNNGCTNWHIVETICQFLFPSSSRSKSLWNHIVVWSGRKKSNSPYLSLLSLSLYLSLSPQKSSYTGRQYSIGGVIIYDKSTGIVLYVCHYVEILSSAEPSCQWPDSVDWELCALMSSYAVIWWLC